VPRSTGLVGEPAERERTAAPVDAEALRRRLGGFQQGLIEGRRDADAEMAAEPGVSRGADPGGSSESAEEARG
jgi:hypothetical protein